MQQLTAVLVVIAIILAAYFGYHYWKKHHMFMGIKMALGGACPCGCCKKGCVCPPGCKCRSGGPCPAS